MSVTRKWSLLAVVLVLAILAAGWFLLVAPKRSEAADLRSQTQQQDDANSQLLADLEQLKQQQADLPKKQAELAVMRKQIPDNPALPTLVRSLTSAGRKVGVSIDTLSPAVPVAVVEPVAATPVVVPPTTESDSAEASSSDGSTADAATTPAPVAAPPAPSLYQVPLTVNVTGSYFELEQFVNKLEGLKRSFLVSGFTLAPAASSTDAGSSTDANAPALGDLTLSLQGRVFLSPPEAAAADAQTTPAAPAAVTGQ